MENQHRKISGYRELSPEEIDMMNRIKAKGAELLELQYELDHMLRAQANEKSDNAAANTAVYAEFDRFMSPEPLRWSEIGKTDIQTGIMALVRAVAQPGGL